MIYDVIIIGGGPAGLNAAVVLGRCLRKVLLFDSGKQRNLYSHGMHNSFAPVSLGNISERPVANINFFE